MIRFIYRGFFLVVLITAMATNALRYLAHSVLLAETSSSFIRKPPIILLHGLLGSSRNFQNWARLLWNKLNRKHDVVVVDLPNHGRTATRFGDVSMNYLEMAEDLQHTLHRLCVSQVHIVGHSMGAKVCAATALSEQKGGSVEVLSTTFMDLSPVRYEDSDFVEVLSTIDMCLRTKEEIGSVFQRQDALEVVNREISDKNLRLFLQSSLEQPKKNADVSSSGFAWKFNIGGIHASREAIADFPFAPGSATPCLKPCLILKGQTSNYIRSLHLDSIKQLFPYFYVRSIANAGHNVHFDKPDETVAAIVSFLGKVEEMTQGKE